MIYIKRINKKKPQLTLHKAIVVTILKYKCFLGTKSYFPFFIAKIRHTTLLQRRIIVQNRMKNVSIHEKTIIY